VLHQAEIVAHQEDRCSLPLQCGDAVEATVGERLVAHRQDLVHHQHVGLHHHRHREPQPDVHPGGVGLDWLIDERTDTGELDDFRQPVQHLRARESQHHPVDDRVVAPGDLGVEARAQLD